MSLVIYLLNYAVIFLFILLSDVITFHDENTKVQVYGTVGFSRN